MNLNHIIILELLEFIDLYNKEFDFLSKNKYRLKDISWLDGSELSEHMWAFVANVIIKITESI